MNLWHHLMNLKQQVYECDRGLQSKRMKKVGWSEKTHYQLFFNLVFCMVTTFVTILCNYCTLISNGCLDGAQNKVFMVGIMSNYL